jgi:Zn-dependent protease with chaperone function
VARRALLAVALLAGAYALCVLAIVVLVVGNFFLVRDVAIAPALLIGSMAIAGTLFRCLVAIERKAPDVHVGIRVDRTTQPDLIDLIHSVAADMGTKPPERVWLIPEVNAYVVQHSRLLGLMPGKRVMAVGVGLLNATDVDGLRAVLAHELGHYAGGDTRLGPVVYRGYATLGRAVRELGDTTLGKVFVRYATWYHRIASDVQRNQELSADQAAARVAGPEATARSLVEIEAMANAYSIFVGAYAMPAWALCRYPENFYAGLRAVAAHRSEELDRIAAAAPATAESFDSHPTTAQRVSALGVAPGSAWTSRPAREILAGPESVEASIAGELARTVSGRPALEPVSWDEYADVVIRTEMQGMVQATTQALAQLQPPVEPTLAGLMTLLNSGRTYRICERLYERWWSHLEAERRQLIYAILAGPLAGMIAEQIGPQVRWTLAWDQRCALVGPEGTRIPVWEWVDRALSGDDGAAEGVHQEVRQWSATGIADGRRPA